MAKKKRGGLGRAIGGLFVDYADDDVKTETIDEDTELTAEEEAELTASLKEPTTTKDETSTVEVNNDIVAALKQVLKDANLPGYDYYEYIKAVEKSDLDSESQKFKVIFSAVEGLPEIEDNGGPDHLLSTADHYIKALAQHAEDFKVTVADAEENNVTVLVEEADGIENEITKLNDTIEQAKKRISDLANKKEVIVAKATANKTTIEQQKSEYSLVFRMFESNIVDNKKKIANYLK